MILILTETENQTSYNSAIPPSSRKRHSDTPAAPDADDDDTVASSEDGESSSSSATAKKKKRKEFQNLNAVFMAGVPGVTLVTDQVIFFSVNIYLNSTNHIHSLYSVHYSHDSANYKRKYRKCAIGKPVDFLVANQSLWILVT